MDSGLGEPVSSDSGMNLDGHAPLAYAPPVVGSAGDLLSESWAPVASTTVAERRARGGLSRPSKQQEQSDSYAGDVIVFGFAAAVGIAFGFLFLKMFAPNVLANLHF